MAIGHIINRALNESDTAGKDRLILDNLTSLDGVGASQDIELFINNLRNESIIYSNEYILEIGEIVITNQLLIPFSNNSEVEVDGIKCIVYNSNGVDRFKLKNKTNNAGVIPEGDIKRSDAVKFENITQLSPYRFPPTKTLNDPNQTEVQIENIDTASESNLDIFSNYNIGTMIVDIDNVVNKYQYTRNKTILLEYNNAIDSLVKIEGSVTVLNLDANGNEIQNQEVLLDEDPGVYIVSSDLTPLRAFSDNSNPWDTTTNAGYNTTQSIKASVGNLTLTDPDITGITITNISSTLVNATHKLPINVNGEVYYLLLIE